MRSVHLTLVVAFHLDPFQQKAHPLCGKTSGNTISKSNHQKCCLSECPIHVRQCSINFLVPLSVAGYIVSRVVCFFLQEDRSRRKGSTAHVNTFPIRWVLLRMRDGGWTLLPNDKEPGFCFSRHSETTDAAISFLVPGSYAEMDFDEMRLPGLMKAYCVIAKGVGAYTREYRTCGRACRHDWHTIFVKGC